jgi:predicted metalloprotease
MKWEAGRQSRNVEDRRDGGGGAGGAQIGDDKLRAGSGRIRPATFTHGTSAQRAARFKRGRAGGRMADCNAFDARTL